MNQLVSSIPKDVLLRTLYVECQQSIATPTAQEVNVERSSVHRNEGRVRAECKTLSGESCTFGPGQDDLSGETMSKLPRDRMLSGESTSDRLRDKILSGEWRNIISKSGDDNAESISSSDDLQSQPWENGPETTSNSDVSEIAIHFLLVEWKQRGLDREMHQDPDRDRYTSDEEGPVIDNAAHELELIAVSKRPTRLLPHATDHLTKVIWKNTATRS